MTSMAVQLTLDLKNRFYSRFTVTRNNEENDMSKNMEISAEYPFRSNFITINGSKMHYIDEGEGDPILFLHGNPTSSYLWRNIIPYLTTIGRCIAPDLIGMGKSDKPDIGYTFLNHSEYVWEFINKMNLKNITLVIHDWGSALGFHYFAHHQNNIKAIAFMEAIIATVKSWDNFPKEGRDLFKSIRSNKTGWDLIGKKNLFIENILPASIDRTLTEEEMNHYREPFLKEEWRKPLWQWPNEIPIEGKPEEVAKAVNNYKEALKTSDLPKILFYCQPGFLIRENIVSWCIKYLKNLSTIDIGKGIHFIQEDNPHMIGEELAKWYKTL